ncbi:hypothetical protein [Sedimentitalea sp.]|uniref:hypothetical protein n=1 Tax=Sedimentitalea sp. TaxID=2048915 RepID=UPI003297CE2B
MTSIKKPAVSLLKGRHITAADKRTIVEGIDWLRAEFAASVAALPEQIPDYAAMWIRRGRSSKRYNIAPTGDRDSYAVTIRENYRTDLGEKRQRDMTVTVRVANIEPLYMPSSEGTGP